MPLIQLIDLCPGYLGRAILPPIRLDLERGDALAVLGRNGAGKSTLLRTILGLLLPVSGRIEREPGVRIGYVPQRAEFFADAPLRTRDWIAMAADEGRSFLAPWGARARRPDVESAIRRAQVTDILDVQVSRLSEGQRQRAALARALVNRPSVLLLDEPTSALDRVAEENVLSVVEELRRSGDVAVILITHALHVASCHSTRVLLVDKDDRVVEQGSFDTVIAGSAFRRLYGISTEHGLHGDHSACEDTPPHDHGC